MSADRGRFDDALALFTPSAPDQEHATGRCYFAVMTHVGLDHWGRYVDEHRVHDGTWRFGQRLVRVDGQSPNSIFPQVPFD